MIDVCKRGGRAPANKRKLGKKCMIDNMKVLDVSSMLKLQKIRKLNLMNLSKYT